ncbi:ATP synthase F0 subunit B [Anoxybacter fermentans]|uniref:ATP synthase subunit b n=1 Tax=Anoxybacter fermentans TaxID=1323375 RepID=A0A3Q9HRA6_9FIRM|nr:F0F1 ATP synthase subunit B [Anoxybacter fermentans]AZR74000.1 ATP synthase F0 subunit B [Anoxybacter fermentans]
MSILPNYTMVWEIINFLVLIVLLKRYFYKPLLNLIDKRREKIKSDLEEAEKSKKKAAELAEKYEARLKAARDEAQEIIAQAEKRGNERREEIIAEAREEAKRIKERAMEEIAQAKRHALSQLRDEVSDISLLIATKFLKESVDYNLHQRLVEEFIDQLDKDKLGEAKC